MDIAWIVICISKLVKFCGLSVTFCVFIRLFFSCQLTWHLYCINLSSKRKVPYSRTIYWLEWIFENIVLTYVFNPNICDPRRKLCRLCKLQCLTRNLLTIKTCRTAIWHASTHSFPNLIIIMSNKSWTIKNTVVRSTKLGIMGFLNGAKRKCSFHQWNSKNPFVPWRRNSRKVLKVY